MEIVKVLHSNIIYKRLPSMDRLTKDSLIVLPGSEQASLDASGILYGGSQQRYKNVLCEVLKVGPGSLMPDGTRQKMGNLKEGDIVIIDQQSGREIEDNLYYCHISEIIGRVEDYDR